MANRALGATLQYLRQTAMPADGSRLDAELLERFVMQHDGAAFARLAERHGPLVMGVCRRVLHHQQDAEDAYQATFLVLARKARCIRARVALASWLYKVAYHLALKLKDSAQRRRQSERQTDAARRLRSEDQITWGDLRRVLDEELHRLPEKYRAPLLLCCLAGRTRDEAAQQLGWTLGALKMRLERGRQLLRTRLVARGLPVSVIFLAMLLAQQATAAAVPALLTTATVKAAVLFASGQTPAPASTQAAALAHIGLAMGTGKIKLVAMVLALLGMVGLTVGLFAPPGPPSSGVTEPNGRRPLAALDRFTNGTEESGLAAILHRHHAAFPGWRPSGATLLDVDGDDRLDLHLAGQGDQLAALGHNVGDRFAYVDPRAEIPRGPRQKGDLPYPGGQVRHAFDHNGDDKLDLVISWHNNGGAWYRNISPNDPHAAIQYRREPFLHNEYPDIRASALADINRDGIVDFLWSSTGTDIAVHWGRSDGTFCPTPGAIIPAGLHCAGAIPVDLDGDNQLELIVRQTEYEVAARRKILRGAGNMKFTDITRQSGLREEGSVHGVGDVNQDGHPDLICVEGQDIVVYLNDGRGRFLRNADAVRGLERAPGRPHSQWGAVWGGAVVADFDNDGKADVIINGKYFLYVLRGSGDGHFEYVNDRWGLPAVSYCGVDDGICFGDVNRDGRLDLVLASSHVNDERRPVGLFLNRLTDHHWLRVRLIGRPGNRAATGAKIRVSEAGGLDQPAQLFAAEQVAVWGRQSFHSYYATRQTERHFGLGRRTQVDVRVEFYPSGRRVERKNVPADGTVVIAEESP